MNEALPFGAGLPAPPGRADPIFRGAQRPASVQGHIGPRVGATARGGEGSGASKRAQDGDMCVAPPEGPASGHRGRACGVCSKGAPCRGGEGMANLKLGIDVCDRSPTKNCPRPKRSPNLVCSGPNFGPKLAPV